VNIVRNHSLSDARTLYLGRSCGLYRWSRGLSFNDLAKSTEIGQMKLIDLEMRYEDNLTDDERQRLTDLVAETEVG
jgi:hypothetical protein